MAGPGTVKWVEAGQLEEDAPTTCKTEDLPARRPIEFEAESTFPIDWAAGCDPLPNDAKRCVALPENRVVMVGFNGEAPPRPFNVQATLRVSRTGSGSGRITGHDLDCGNDCREPLDFAKIVTLQAEPAAGSRFDGWIGVCGSNPTCRFAVGPVTCRPGPLRQRRPPPPPPPPPPPSPPPPPRLEVRIVKLTSARQAGRWRVIARIAVNKRVSARARVGRQRRRGATRPSRSVRAPAR